MLLDENLILCENVDFFGDAHDDEQIGDIIDLGQFDTGKPGLSDGSPVADYNATNPNFGGVKPMSLLLHITESMVGGTSVIFRLYSGTAVDETFGLIGGNFNINWESSVIAQADAVKGYKLVVPFPYNSEVPVLRYLQMTVTRVADCTAGKFNAMLIAGAQQWQPLHANYRQL